MAIKTVVNDLKLTRCHDTAISTNTTTNTSIIDTADADLGTTWFLGITGFTDGVFKIAFQEGDDPALADAVTVDASKIVTATPNLVTTGAIALTDNGGDYLKAAVFSTKRYVRAQIVSTGVTIGSRVSVLCLRNGEVLPM